MEAPSNTSSEEAKEPKTVELAEESKEESKSASEETKTAAATSDSDNTSA